MTETVDQLLAARFRRAQNAFADDWKVGTFDWLQKNAVGTMVTLTLVEQQLDRVWLATKKGPARIAEFDAVLARWQAAHVAALKEFTERSGQ